MYFDLGYLDSAGMQRKSCLATKILRTIRTRQQTLDVAADMLGIAKTRLSKIIRGQFREVSEAELLKLVASCS